MSAFEDVVEDLADKVRSLINERTLSEGVSELEGVEIGAQVCEQVQNEFDMRAEELEREAEEE